MCFIESRLISSLPTKLSNMMVLSWEMPIALVLTTEAKKTWEINYQFWSLREHPV